MTAPHHKEQIRSSFDRAAGYDSAATVQRLAARELATRLARSLDGRKPARILEIGCGTGLLTEQLVHLWPDAQIVATDFAPQMLERARRHGSPSTVFKLMDAANPTEEGPFDVVCGNLVMQWVAQPEQALARLGKLLTPGGVLAVSTLLDGTFAEWKAACAREDVPPSTPRYPDEAHIQNWAPWLYSGLWEHKSCVQAFASGLDFVRHLRATGASVAPVGNKPMGAGSLRRVAHRLDQSGAAVTWELAYGCFRKPPVAGVFVTGTDTGVGKTLVSACLVKRWQAAYWKPLQSGLADEAGDTSTVASLAGGPVCFPPAGAFQASLSPQAAAEAEGVCIDPTHLALPEVEAGRVLVVEGAGGLMVPATDGVMMLDLAVLWGLPVVLVARSGLGTLNHTLLSLQAMRSRGVAVAGVVLNGPHNPANSRTIARLGKVRILAEVGHLAQITPDVVAHQAATFPTWEEVCSGP
ncbi:dethiobiotin synthase [Acetobacter sp. LMG 32666]|uniref:dethiobiotin synthase n=1 Tax=Acetobacter sp. LMG 32666 TaxID=2959295 RepID=UPI0030C7AC69